jgi:hypothetical protein
VEGEKMRGGNGYVIGEADDLDDLVCRFELETILKSNPLIIK